MKGEGARRADEGSPRRRAGGRPHPGPLPFAGGQRERETETDDLAGWDISVVPETLLTADH